jgi:hypothetical protein
MGCARNKRYRTLYEDTAVFLEDDEQWCEPQSDMIGGLQVVTTTISFSDLDLNKLANYHATATANWASVRHQYRDEDMERMRPWLEWIPIENIRKTLENTTQLAKAVSNYPMMRHLVSRFKLLNRFRLREIVSTDTTFSSVRAVGGARCAQVFHGLTSHHMDVYGMESKRHFDEVYKEFIRDQGIPLGLHRDNASEQKCSGATQLNREYQVKESFAEAGYPNQDETCR